MKNLLERFQDNLRELQITDNQKLLLAVSGGVDSLLMVHLSIKSKLNIELAHANFGLRGIESDQDQKFVEDFCETHSLILHTKKLNVKARKKEGNYSTQMAARDLRYEWFQELIKENDIDFISTAHHLDDSLETFLINLSRGSGLKGLAGIPKKNSNIIRPMLNFSKEEILDYARDNNIKWREDSSNNSQDYLRNKIRHSVVPVLKEIQPDLLHNFSKTQRRLRDNTELLDSIFDKKRQKLFEKNEDNWVVSISDLEKLNPLRSQIYHLFKKFNIKNPDQVLQLLKAESGAKIDFGNYLITKKSYKLLIYSNLNKVMNEEIILEEGKTYSINDRKISFQLSDSRHPKAVESLEASIVHFPLTLRKFSEGDSFSPLGMKGKKKIGKYLRDRGVDSVKKQESKVLVDNQGEILWVLNHQISEKYKVTECTTKYLNIFLD